ncbi:thiol:disulfide interchange protein DsbA/DsbL [Kangiella sp. HZ709]|uniref:thiol:disulfide interchange protein DsbA/DsbL n=1 Tax=Kangiella sp. HZ709 TaxID=2666328 RepID=UPI0012B00BBB|nr:thiol:disulfide interchange protein DsbA/DsbL [Kangiella sp. HZ709]MRX27933.1 thioredoxin domain-containing protein [Kangiella sp. HZ709]
MKIKSLFVAAFSLLALVQVACAESATPGAPNKYKEGADYTVIEGTKGIDKPQVIEFFSYTCPHCYNMEGFLHKWEPKKPESIEFVRVPVFLPQVPHLTQGYYTAEVLGVLDPVHMEIFHQWHRDKKIVRTKKDLLPIFEKAGITAEAFEKAYNSFAVASKVQNAKKMVREFKVTSFPKLVVNQKYQVKNYQQLDKLLTELPLEKAK